MLLSALTLAAALQATPFVEFPATPLAKPPAKARPRFVPRETLLSDRQVEAWKAQLDRTARCGANGLQKALGATPEAPPSAKILAKRSSSPLKRLGDLPPAHGEWAVARTVDGCPVSTPIVQRTPAP